ncbi:unnamed protein product [Effrenium voratum]|uniref:Uncharacterized protein n=1 Tax=Effrenium voratum TaxID=2562239 RepID=A0AA36IV95_9DINO|nr:unnamed protein product [Effrenium voratum]CAJ1424585.1 unnamed protein product [Effrenium voratum]
MECLDFTEYDLEMLETALSDDDIGHSRIEEERQKRRAASKRIRPIWEAAESGNLEVLHALSTGSPRVNAKDIDGFTPAAHAVHAEKLDAFELLVSKRANLLAGDAFGGCPLRTIMSSPYPGQTLDSSFLLKWLDVVPPKYFNCEVTNGLAAIHYCAEAGCVEALAMTVRKGSCADLRCRYNAKTPAHYAAASGHVAALRYLVDAWADLSIEDRAGKTALQQAKERTHHDAARFLEGAVAERRFRVLKPFILYHRPCPSHATGARRANLVPGLGGHIREGIEVWSQLSCSMGSCVLEFLLGGQISIQKTWLQDHFAEVASLTQEVHSLRARVQELEQEAAQSRLRSKQSRAWSCCSWCK